MPKETSSREKSLRESITHWEGRIARGETNPYIEDYPQYLTEQLARRRKQLAELLAMSPQARTKEEAKFKQIQEEEAEIEAEAEENDDEGEEPEANRIDQALAKFEKEHPVKRGINKSKSKSLGRFVDSVERQLNQELSKKKTENVHWEVIGHKWVRFPN